MESELNTAVGESNDDANCKCSRSPSKSSSRPQSSVVNTLYYVNYFNSINYISILVIL